MAVRVTRFSNVHLRRRITPWLVVGSTAFVLLLLRFIGFEVYLQASLERFFQPFAVTAAQSTAALLAPSEAIFRTQQLQYRLRDLEGRYAELLSQVNELEQLRSENQALRSMIENTDRSLAPTVLAAPITAYGSSFIGIGAEEGVVVGDPVLLGNVLLGRVSEVSWRQSQVMLLSQPQTTPVVVQTESGLTGLVTGDGRRVLLTELETNSTIELGSVVRTVGQPQIAPGLTIGQVVSVLENEAAGTQQAVLDQGVSFFDTTLVEVRPSHHATR